MACCQAALGNEGNKLIKLQIVIDNSNRSPTVDLSNIFLLQQCIL